VLTNTINAVDARTLALRPPFGTPGQPRKSQRHPSGPIRLLFLEHPTSKSPTAHALASGRFTPGPTSYSLSTNTRLLSTDLVICGYFQLATLSPSQVVPIPANSTQTFPACPIRLRSGEYPGVNSTCGPAMDSTPRPTPWTRAVVTALLSQR
jgi:hypothetical protein